MQNLAHAISLKETKQTWSQKGSDVTVTLRE